VLPQLGGHPQCTAQQECSVSVLSNCEVTGRAACDGGSGEAGDRAAGPPRCPHFRLLQVCTQPCVRADARGRAAGLCARPYSCTAMGAGSCVGVSLRACLLRCLDGCTCAAVIGIHVMGGLGGCTALAPPLHPHAPTRTCTQAHTSVHMRMQATHRHCARAHTHTHIHTHTHSRVHRPPLPASWRARTSLPSWPASAARRRDTRAACYGRAGPAQSPSRHRG